MNQFSLAGIKNVYFAVRFSCSLLVCLKKHYRHCKMRYFTRIYELLTCQTHCLSRNTHINLLRYSEFYNYFWIGFKLTHPEQKHKKHNGQEIQKRDAVRTGRMVSKERRTESTANLPKHNIQIRNKRANGPSFRP